VKVLLINPPQTFYPNSNAVEGNLPLGLMYVASVLEKSGYAVEILDAFFAGSSNQKTGDAVEVGLSLEAIKGEIQRRKPDVVGVGNPFSTQVNHAVEIAELVKALDSGIVTVVGGPHVSTVPKQFLESAKAVDVAVVGEGEYTMLDVIKACEGKKSLCNVEGIAYHHDRAVSVNPPRAYIKNLDELPYPAYHLLDMEKYLNPKIGYRSSKPYSLPMITSRGCPMRCCFCSVHLHMGNVFRAHSPEYVAGHLEFVMEKYGVKYVLFEDDNLTYDLNRMNAICNQIIKRKLQFQWETPNGIRVDCVNFELLKKMKAAGCRSVVFGVESGDQWVSLNIVHKGISLNNVVDVAKMCKQIGLKCSMFYIIGFPGETKENMMRTVDFALHLKRTSDVGMRLFVATPLFGTKLYEDCVEHGYLREDLTSRALAEVRQANGKPLIETPNFTVEDVQNISAFALKEYRKIALAEFARNPVKLFRRLGVLKRKK
jgi:anaerobic magnesium-protoporphyrin IX monomethyl ester cyclase